MRLIIADTGPINYLGHPKLTSVDAGLAGSGTAFRDDTKTTLNGSKVMGFASSSADARVRFQGLDLTRLSCQELYDRCRIECCHRSLAIVQRF